MAGLDNSVRLMVIDHYFRNGNFENMSSKLLDLVESDLSGRDLDDYLYSCLGLNFNSNFTMQEQLALRNEFMEIGSDEFLLKYSDIWDLEFDVLEYFRNNGGIPTPVDFSTKEKFEFQEGEKELVEFLTEYLRNAEDAKRYIGNVFKYISDVIHLGFMQEKELDKVLNLIQDKKFTQNLWDMLPSVKQNPKIDEITYLGAGVIYTPFKISQVRLKGFIFETVLKNILLGALYIPMEAGNSIRCLYAKGNPIELIAKGYYELVMPLIDIANQVDMTVLELCQLIGDYPDLNFAIEEQCLFFETIRGDYSLIPFRNIGEDLTLHVSKSVFKDMFARDMFKSMKLTLHGALSDKKVDASIDDVSYMLSDIYKFKNGVYRTDSEI